jgi:predicted dehydrogenase
MSIKWGILGTSPISETMAKAIQASSTGELVAIGSRSAESGKNFANKFSIPYVYEDYHALLQSDVDAVYVGLPNHFHKEWVMHAITAGKHVLCEKPFVISSAEAREVIALVENKNIICMEALMYRFHPFTKKLNELIKNKIIGDVKLYNAAYTANIAAIANPAAGGGIRNLGCYPISLVRLLANAEPREIKALGRLNRHNKNDSQASCILQFDDGAMAVVSTSDDIEMFYQFDIYGTEGSLKITTNPWMPNETSNKITIDKNGEQSVEINVTADKPLYAYQIDAVGDAIIHKKYKNHDGISLADSLGNITVLENWIKQVC